MSWNILPQTQFTCCGNFGQNIQTSSLFYSLYQSSCRCKMYVHGKTSAFKTTTLPVAEEPKTL